MIEVADFSDSEQSEISNNTQTEQREAAIKEFQQRLVLLHHASRCDQEDRGRCRVSPYCAEMKALYQHVNACNIQQCPYTHCVSTRFLLSHYYKCGDNPDCQICKPLKDNLLRIHKRNRSIVQVPPLRRSTLEELESPMVTPRETLRDEHAVDEEGQIPSSKFLRMSTTPPPNSNNNNNNNNNNHTINGAGALSPRALLTPRSAALESSLEDLTRRLGGNGPSLYTPRLSPLITPRDNNNSNNGRNADAPRSPRMVPVLGGDKVTSGETLSEGKSSARSMAPEDDNHVYAAAPPPPPATTPAASNNNKPKPSIPLLSLASLSRESEDATTILISRHGNVNDNVHTVTPPPSHMSTPPQRMPAMLPVHPAAPLYPPMLPPQPYPVSQYTCGQCHSGIGGRYRYYCSACAVDFCSACYHCEQGEPHEHPVRAFVIQR